MSLSSQLLERFSAAVDYDTLFYLLGFTLIYLLEFTLLFPCQNALFYKIREHSKQMRQHPPRILWVGPHSQPN